MSLPASELERLARELGLGPDGVSRLAEALSGSSTTLPTTLHADSGGLETVDEWTAEQTTQEGPAAVVERYEDLGPIGVGGMGEVRRVRDRELNRNLAMKVIKASLMVRPAALSRFVEEAQCSAQLQHPGIVPIHDLGRLPDGRLWFTMPEVHGRTLAEVIDEVHSVSQGPRWEQTSTGWTFKRLVDALRRACEAVAHAHQRGVLHRDLKPANVMVGEHGEVWVLDWGLAKVLARPQEDAEHTVVTDRSSDDALATRVGHVAGTPAYMSPEQARGDVHLLDARTDVYSLGAMLYEILAGRRPFSGRSAKEVLGRVGWTAPEPLVRTGPPLPAELVELCERAMARERDERLASVELFLTELEAWLEGRRLLEQAREVAARAVAGVPRANQLRQRADQLEERARALLAEVAPWAGEEEKGPGWALQDEAAALRREADREELEVDQGLHAALRIDPALAAAHAALAMRNRDRHEQAEAERNSDRVAHFEALLRFHTEALPQTHEVRQQCTTYLSGVGALSLVTDPPGAEVELFRYEHQKRRLVAVPLRQLGRTPLTRVPLEMGSYLCRIRHPQRAPVDYPVHIGRGEHWHGIAPGENAPRQVLLPAASELGADDCYVPAGWFIAGGDASARDSLVRTPLWCDGFVLKRFPVTNRRYLAFLNDLLLQGREAEALEVVPRDEGGASGTGGAMVYGRAGPDSAQAGQFQLVPDAQGDTWSADWPVFMVHWGSAVAYARWLSERSGHAWRLPGELEWEKAARGVDGRLTPWGDRLDPSWCCMRDSHEGRPMPADVATFPVDQSPYGVRGLGGNVRDWCGDLFRVDRPELAEQRVPVPDLPEVVDLVTSARRSARGGYWGGLGLGVWSANRFGFAPAYKSASISFRLARSLPLPG